MLTQWLYYNDKLTFARTMPICHNLVMNTFGERLKERRLEAKIGSNELCARLGMSTGVVSKWENGDREPNLETIRNLAAALNTTVAYLMGETDEPAQANNSRQCDRQPLKEPLPNARLGSFCRIPVLSVAQAASCGAGNGLYGVDEGYSDFVMLDMRSFACWDNTRKPFGIHTDGDSMVGAGLVEGSVAIINPAEEVMSGDAALVVWNDRGFIKWVIWKPGGDVELRSANPNYGPILVEKEYAENPDWFKVIGKVVSTVNIGKPKSAF